MKSANNNELRGNHAPSSNMLKVVPSLEGNHSALFKNPSESRRLINPFMALYCKAKPRTKNVGNARIGAIIRDLSIGSSASIITFLTITNVVYAKIPPSKGDATQLITILVTTAQSTLSGET